MAQSIIDTALANIDAQIADLQRARDIIINVDPVPLGSTPPKVRKPRGKNKPKPGLPADKPEDTWTCEHSTTRNTSTPSTCRAKT